MKLIIAGSRTIKSELAEEIIDSILGIGKNISEVVSGHALGVDLGGELWAKAHKKSIRVFLPDWNLHGRKAAFLRNSEMAFYGDHCIALWDGVSGGTRHMISVMEDLKKPVDVWIVDKSKSNNYYWLPIHKWVTEQIKTR